MVLWLVGGGNLTSNLHIVPQTAAYAGYRTINLSWDNPGGVSFESRCGPGEGSCDSDCLFDVVSEYLTGVDAPPAAGDTDDTYEPHPMRSIEGKLKLALEHLHERDTNLHSTPEEGWDAYCTTTEVNWELVEVAGFSMGAQMASYISYIEPGSATTSDSIGFFGADLGVPSCEYDPVSGNPDPTDAHYPALMDDHSSLPPCGETSSCPSDNRFVLLHEDGIFSGLSAGGEVVIDLVDLGFPQEGISYPPAAIDDAIEDDELLDAGGHLDQTAYGNLLQTDFTPAGTNGAHGSMAEDSKLVSDRLSQNLALNPSDYYLLPVYLEAFCELSQ